MSGGEALGRYWVLAALGVGEEHPIPLNPADGSIWVTAVGGGGIPTGASRPVELIAPAASTKNGVVNFTSANSGIVFGFYWQVPATTPAGLYAQLHDGIVAPVSGVTIPLKRSPIPVTPGEEYVYEPPFGLTSQVASPNDGFTMVLSTTQDVYTDPGATGVMQPRATGIF